ncbi:Uncharacterised protein [Mycobacteroides abscessus]|nr:Uncharacterised protein [Mycobacteroides abscessus]
MLGAPTENVNAPATGCVSSDTTRQLTTYVPSPRVVPGVTTSASSTAATSTSTGVPSAARTVVPPGTTWTGSLKVRVSASGGASRTVPSCGAPST